MQIKPCISNFFYIIYANAKNNYCLKGDKLASY